MVNFNRFPDVEVNNDFYMTVLRKKSPDNVIYALSKFGWSTRNCSLTDYEAENEFSDLLIESNASYISHISIILINPEVNVNLIVEAITSVDEEWHYEIYNESGEIEESKQREGFSKFDVS